MWKNLLFNGIEWLPQILDFCFCCDRLCDREWVILTCHYIDHTHTQIPINLCQQNNKVYTWPQCPISQTAVLYRTYTYIPVFVVFTGNTDHQWSDRGGLIASQRDQGVSSYERHVHPTHIRKKACSIDHGPIVRWVTLHLFAFMCCDF